MRKHTQVPYLAHVFVCTNDRKGERRSCADNDAVVIKETLKEGANERGWRGKVRISTAGCMGLCADGPNLIIYPQKIWFSAVSPADVEEILSTIEGLITAS